MIRIFSKKRYEVVSRFNDCEITIFCKNEKDAINVATKEVDKGREVQMVVRRY